eukprot:1072430-Pelagomonas_calceolata.AAC.1
MRESQAIGIRRQLASKYNWSPRSSWHQETVWYQAGQFPKRRSILDWLVWWSGCQGVDRLGRAGTGYGCMRKELLPLVCGLMLRVACPFDAVSG